jgi:von Willebrand factor type A domain
MRRPLGLALLSCLVACGSSGKSGIDPDGGGGGGTADGGTIDGTTQGTDGSVDGTISLGMDGSGMGGEGGSCIAPDMLVVLDHTDSMSDEPNGTQPPNTAAGEALTKWWLATEAVKAVVAPPLDEKVAYGLELFPLDPETVDAGGKGSCKTLSQLLGGSASNNTSCQPAEILVPPATGTGATITTILDPTTLRLCVSTPIALALGTAQTELQSVAKSGVGQYVLLVTDGAETCSGDVTAAAQKLAAAGIKTFVVGFGSADAGAAGVSVPTLNDAACAGMTAIGFPAPCTKVDGGAGYVATKPSGPPVFYLAEDGASLQTALQKITSTVCCGCVQ